MKRRFRTDLAEDIKFHIITLLALVFFIAAIYYATSIKMERKYLEAVEMIKSKNWDAAEQCLDRVANYKDVEVLKRYVWARIEMEYKGENDLTGDYYDTVLAYLQEIPESYQGEFKREITNFKSEIMHKYKQTCGSEGQRFNGIKNTPIKVVSIDGRCVYIEKDVLAPIFSSEYMGY
ncbi:ribosomal protein S18 [Desulfohalotomaculum tongense]|uniref:hypothetical protein n=1 Tax=Desulforadius tongensis TaxID=1216062 RepID=UPI00195B40C0|nr:hypothetical protein [Desulforadius tongensis]MBM7854861.1 ribosomal protein S18 [Desulforadius tongensis]